jgi:hypothetical protein
MTTELPLCFRCKHYRGQITCDAFPGGIPDEILISAVDHKEPYEGDNGIRFEDAGGWIVEDEE